MQYVDMVELYSVYCVERNRQEEEDHDVGDVKKQRKTTFNARINKS